MCSFLLIDFDWGKGVELWFWIFWFKLVLVSFMDFVVILVVLFVFVEVVGNVCMWWMCVF